jgi:type II secretion system protein I
MKKAFTLVELMVTVSILAIGVVMVLRSFLNSACSLDFVSNKIEAVGVIERRINELQFEAIQENGLGAFAASQEAKVGGRRAELKTEVSPSAVEGLNEARLDVSWRQEDKNKNEALVAYFKKKE